MKTPDLSFEMSISGMGLPSAVPDCRWTTRTDIVKNGNKHRKRRPHSSPVRYVQGETVCPNDQPGNPAGLSRPPSPMRPVGDSLRSLLDLARGDLPSPSPPETQTGDLCNVAYFSPLPPAAPLRLVSRQAARSVCPPPCEKPVSAAEPLLVHKQTTMAELPNCSELKNLPQGIQHILQTLPTAGGMLTTSQSSNHDTIRTSATSFGSSIESVTSAPPPLATCSASQHPHAAPSQAPKTVPAAPIQPDPVSHDIKSVGKIAIQEPVQVPTDAGDFEGTVKSHISRDEPGEWLGVVRALRDSHVRLVLRQLRHIDRLNRALDHATTTTSASQQ